MKRLFTVACFVITCKCLAQQDPQFTQYMFNNLYFNPGFAGIDGNTQLTTIIRSQWTGYQPTNYGGGPPNTQIISFSMPLAKLRSGFGAYIMNDKLGPQNNLEFQATYAYHFKLKTGKLSVGGRIGIYDQIINSNLYHYIDQGDTSIPPPGRYSQTKPDAALGILYKSEKLYVGAGLDHLTKSKFTYGLGDKNRLEPHLYVTAGYLYDFSFDTKIQFATLIKSDLVKIQYDLSAIAYLRNTLWGGLSFRQQESASVLVGWSFLKNKTLRAGYAMDIVIRDRAAKQPLSHELMLSYLIPTGPPVGKKILRTPRYRKN